MRLLVSAICLSVLLPAAAIAGDITVTITNVESAQGSVRGAIYDSAAAFMNLPKAKAKFKVAASAGA